MGEDCGMGLIAGVVVAVLLGLAFIIVPSLALRDFLAHFWTVFSMRPGRHLLRRFPGGAEELTHSRRSLF